MAVSIEVSMSGPMFDGRADYEAEQATQKAAKDIGEEGLRMVRENLGEVIRTHPTGRYIPSVKLTGTDSSFTIGTSIIYGRWIEGTGSRNRTTRFKGYSTFRRTAQQLQSKSTEIAERAIIPYVERM
jgi:hypothetical protein